MTKSDLDLRPYECPNARVSRRRNKKWAHRFMGEMRKSDVWARGLALSDRLKLDAEAKRVTKRVTATLRERGIIK